MPNCKAACILILCSLAQLALAQSPAKYIHQNGQQVNLKKKHLVFVSKGFATTEKIAGRGTLATAFDTSFHKLYGVPNFKGSAAKACYQLGYKEEVVLSFNDRLIQNESGKDLFVFNVKEMNGLKVFISEKGKSWKEIGELSNEEPFLNLKSKIDPQVNYKYIKLKNYCRIAGRASAVYLDAVGISVDKEKYDYRWFEIETDTLYLPNKPMHVRMRDKSLWDGDRVDVFVDEEKFLKDIMISKICRKHELILEEGAHAIKIRAITEGRIKPNTVQIEIIVDDRIYYKSYRLKKQRSAGFVLEVL